MLPILKKILLFVCLLIVSSCGQDYNSNYNDKGQYTTIVLDTSTPEGARFAAAYQVLQTQCMACHAWSSYNTSAKWIDSGYVVQGNYSGSPVISILKNYGGTMPKDPYPTLSASDIASLQAWITNL